MQLLESSVLGLRAARHVFTDTAGTEVTLFPMVHLAEAGFFQTIHTDAFSHDAVLVEGVRSPIARRITRAYRWMGGALGGLVVQPPWPTSEQTEILHADIPPEQFDAAWRETAAPTRWLFEVAAPVQGLVMRFTSSRASLARSLVTDDLPSRNDVMLWQPAYAGLTRALLDLRNAHLVDTLRTVLARSPAPPKRIAIVYGAGHMPALLRYLRQDADFQHSDSQWLTVFST